MVVLIPILGPWLAFSVLFPLGVFCITMPQAILLWPLGFLSFLIGIF